MSCISKICFATLVISVFTCVTIYVPLASIAANVEAQAQTQLVPLVTDQTSLALPNVFGVPGGAGGVVNQSGDYAFFGNGALAVFHRRAGTPSAVRVMQGGDEVPGFPGSSADLMQRINLNNSGLLAFHVDFFQSNGVGQGIIFTFNGTSLQRIVAGDDLAPGGGGTTFGRTIQLVGLNDSGDVAFTSFGTGQTTLYIVPFGGAPVRVAGVGDVAPGTAGGTYSTLIMLGFNNLGEELIRANITGGSGGQGLFVGSTSTVRKIVATDDARPEGGTFPAPTTGFLNNAGQVAFQAGGPYINTPGMGTSLPVATGDVAPAPIAGIFGANRTIQAFDDAGDLAFTANVTGSAVSSSGLFRFRPGNPVEVVAYVNQAAPGAPGQTFSAFAAISINSTGLISFRGQLAGGSIAFGIFKQSGGSLPTNIALAGQATTLPGGGTYGLAVPVAVATTQSLDSGSVFFRSDIAGGTAHYAEVLVLDGVTTVLMSTADTLPAGAHASLRTFKVGAAGNFVGFLAQRNGGPYSIAVHHITTQATSVLASEGDPVPGMGGGRLRIATRNTVFVNADGSVVFSANIIGGTAPGGAVLIASPGGGLAKVAASGDVDPGSGATLTINSGTVLNILTPTPLNDAGQVVFFADMTPAPVPGQSPRGLFVWSSGTGISKVAAVGDLTSAGVTIVGFPAESLSINSGGQVAFVAVISGNPTVVPGIYVGSPGGTPGKVVAAGDPGPFGSAFATFVTPGFNDSGEVAFKATLAGGPGGGVFVGSTSGPPVPLALNGDAAPTGGNFSITAARADAVINNQHDVVFHADLTGGTANSGHFVRRGPLGTLQAAVLQGDPAPGTMGVFTTISRNFNGLINENFQLGPAGDLAFQTSYLANGQPVGGNWHLKTDNTIEEIFVNTTLSPEFGGGIALISAPSTSWNSDGRFAMWARVSGGTFTDGIFLFVPVINTNTPEGTSVLLDLTDATTGTQPVSLTFASVTEAGNTSLTTSSGGPAIPAAFALGNPPVFYNIETTAAFSGSIAVCIDFSSVSFPPGSTLRLMHFEGGVWVDVTTSGPSGNIICGSVTSLSPFTVVQVIGTDLAITKTVTPDPVRTGSDITYTIGITNNGPNAATVVTVSDNLPASTTFVFCSATNGGVCGGSGHSRTVTFGSLASGASATITMITTVNSSLADNTVISNTATVSSLTPDPDLTNNSATATTTASNPPPMITVTTISRQQGSPASASQIATVSDANQAANTLVVTVNGSSYVTVNGVTVSGLSVDSKGAVTANVVAACGATNASFALTVTDSGGTPVSVALDVAVTANTPPLLTYNSPQTVAAGGALTINPTAFPSDNGSVSSVVVQGQGAFTGTVTVNNMTGVVSISGAKPGGAHTITIRSTDNCDVTAEATFILNVTCPEVSVGPVSLPNGFVGSAYNATLTAAGGTGPHSFSVSAGILPDGLSLSSAGALTGMLTAPGTFSFTARATDTKGCLGTRDYTMIVSGSGLQFYPLPTPVRLMETRAGFSGCTNPGNPINANDTFTLQARTACAGIPANAAAVTGNITVVPSGPGFLTLFPSIQGGGAAQPTVANSNFAAGEITNNVFTVGLGAGDGAFKIFTSATTHIIADVTGYYAPPGEGGLYFHPLATPVRLLETRAGFTGCFAPGNPLNGTGNPNADPSLDLELQGRTPIPSPCNSIPASAKVLVGNATSVLPSGGGYLTIYPSGGNRPTVASSNYAGADVINGPFAVKLGADGKFRIYTFATTHLVVDILGYYSEEVVDANGAGLLFNPLPAPVRLLETRPDFPGFPLTGCTRTNAKIQGNLTSATHTQSAGGFCGLPATAQAVVGNVSVVNSEGAGFLTLFPANLTTAPLVATSNYPAPATFGYNRHYFVGLSPVDGKFKVLTQFTTDLILDASGYFAP